MNASLIDNKLSLKKLYVKLLDGELNVSSKVSLLTKEIKLKGEYLNANLHYLNSFLKKHNLTLKGKISSKLDIKLDIDNIRKINGSAKLFGKNIKIKGIDLDQLINGFIDSREVGLLEESKSIPSIGSGSSIIKQINIDTVLKMDLFQ